MRGGWEKLVAYMVMTDVGATPGNLSAWYRCSPTSKENSALFEDGPVRRPLQFDGTGQWIPLS